MTERSRQDSRSSGSSSLSHSPSSHAPSQMHWDQYDTVLKRDEKDIAILIDKIREEISQDNGLVGLFKQIWNNPMIKHIQNEVDILNTKYRKLRTHVDATVRSLTFEVHEKDRELQHQKKEISEINSKAQQKAEEYIKLFRIDDSKDSSWYQGSRRSSDKMFSKEQLVRILETTLQINQGNSSHTLPGPTNNHGPVINLTVDPSTVKDLGDLSKKYDRAIKLKNMAQKMGFFMSGSHKSSPP
jgi:hypothetical protein